MLQCATVKHSNSAGSNLGQLNQAQGNGSMTSEAILSFLKRATVRDVGVRCCTCRPHHGLPRARASVPEPDPAGAHAYYYTGRYYTS
jgi:hypothetical protein